MAEVQLHLKEVNISVEITGRPKHYFSIFNKMQKHGLPIEGLYDFLGIRVLTRSVRDCYGALGIVHKFWKPIPGRFKDYIAVPKPNMYQSLHTTVLYEGKPLEVQIRTEEMNRIAEDGIAAHWDYKETSGREATPDYKEKLSWLRNLIEWYQDVKDASEFMETVKVELFQYHVYVFTPKGDVIELPQGSTPVDFAYYIHSDVGHRCMGAKVNGHIVPLDYSLQNGDIVSIITSKAQKGPSRDWLKFVQSTNAKKKIRAWLKKEFREEYIVSGEKEFLDTLARAGGDKEMEKFLKTSAFSEEVKNLGFPSVEEMFAGIGAGEVRSLQVLHKLFPQLSEKAERVQTEKLAEKAQAKPDREERKKKAKHGPRIIVGGLDSAMVKASHCCNPIPGDPIFGFITRGRGVTVHRTDCSNAKSLMSSPEARVIDVHWDMGIQIEQTKGYVTRLRLETEDRTGMLNSVTTVISGQGVNILAASARTTKKGTGLLEFSVEVRDTSQLQSLIRSLQRLAGVEQVFRVDSGASGKS